MPNNNGVFDVAPASAGGIGSPRSRDLYLGAGILLAALVPRLILAAAREPFYDELFTLWISEMSWPALIDAVRLDSGPPLYYALVHLLDVSTVAGLRTLSLIVGLATCGLVLAWTSLGARRFIAAAHVAVFPPHVYFSGEGRAYAMASLGVAIGVLAAHEWSESNVAPASAGGGRWLVVSCAALLIAAYSHYYGALFFATPLVVATRRSMRDALVATAVMIAAFIPGVLLAFSQPRQAVAWMNELPLFLPLQNLAFAARYPDVFLRPVPRMLHFAALLLTLLIAWSGRRDRLALRFGVITFMPIVAVFVLRLAGYAAYFPIRFESVLAVPFVLWMACALAAEEPRRRTLLASLCIVLGSFVCVTGALVHFERGPDPFRRGAMFVTVRLDPALPIVASGYAYLEALSVGRHVEPFPREQALHPGWRANRSPEQLASEMADLPAAFVWFGEAESLEAAVLRARYTMTPLMMEGGILVARAERRSL